MRQDNNTKFTDRKIYKAEELVNELQKVGNSLRIWINNGSYKVHIEAVLQDANSSRNTDKIIVCRFYGHTKQYWHYVCEPIWRFVISNCKQENQ